MEITLQWSGASPRNPAIYTMTLSHSQVLPVPIRHSPRLGDASNRKLDASPSHLLSLLARALGLALTLQRGKTRGGTGEHEKRAMSPHVQISAVAASVSTVPCCKMLSSRG